MSDAVYVSNVKIVRQSGPVRVTQLPGRAPACHLQRQSSHCRALRSWSSKAEGVTRCDDRRNSWVCPVPVILATCLANRMTPMQWACRERIDLGHRDGRVRSISIVSNPEKLERLPLLHPLTC